MFGINKNNYVFLHKRGCGKLIDKKNYISEQNAVQEHSNF